MTWVPSRRGWMKEYQGKKYAVSCRQLNVPETKEASYQAANDWWRKKRAEIDGPATQARPDPRVQVLEEIVGRPITDQEDLTNTLYAVIAAGLESHEKGEPFFTRDQQAKILGEARLKGLEDSVQAFRNPQQAVDGSIGAHAKLWHDHQQAQVHAGQLTPDRCSNNQTCLAHFLTYASASAPVESIDASRLQGFYSWCLGKLSARRSNIRHGWSVAYARDVFSVTKSFLRWLWEQGAIDLPKNIGSKSFKFGHGVKAIKTWTVEEFKLAVTEAPGKLKLGILLMANCGMTQEDVSDLLDSEVDWTEGYITRKRSKTAAHESVPTVCYKLWPLTFNLLKRYRSGSERVLLTESGLPYVRKELKSNGKVSKADGFASNWVHVKKRLKLNRPLKQLRKLGATILEGHENYGRFKVLFLGHSPKSVADKHYAAPSQELFDRAVIWVGQQLGQVACDPT